MENKELIFICGGARSGKSTFAEQIAMKQAQEKRKRLHYIATSRPTDAEMKHRVRLHQQQRAQSGADWKTWECPMDLDQIASAFQSTDIVLLDCLTILLSNELFAQNDDEAPVTTSQIIFNILHGIKMITKKAGMFIIVSNEVLYESVLDNSIVQTYQEILGQLHQEIVKVATKAYAVEAGIPVLMKGDT